MASITELGARKRLSFLQLLGRIEQSHHWPYLERRDLLDNLLPVVGELRTVELFPAARLQRVLEEAEYHCRRLDAAAAGLAVAEAEMREQAMDLSE